MRGKGAGAAGESFWQEWRQRREVSPHAAENRWNVISQLTGPREVSPAGNWEATAPLPHA